MLWVLDSTSSSFLIVTRDLQLEIRKATRSASDVPGRHILPLCSPELSRKEAQYAPKGRRIRVEPLREFRVGTPKSWAPDSPGVQD